jgi:hypothetical protein
VKPPCSPPLRQYSGSPEIGQTETMVSSSSAAAPLRLISFLGQLNRPYPELLYDPRLDRGYRGHAISTETIAPLSTTAFGNSCCHHLNRWSLFTS